MIAQHPLAAVLIFYPAWLSVWYVDLQICVYVSVNVWLETDVDYAPVRELLADSGARLCSTEVVPDTEMMGARARVLTYTVDRPPRRMEVLAA
jgi:hypothetical protein